MSTSPPSSPPTIEQIKAVLEYLLTPSLPVVSLGLFIVFVAPILVHVWITRQTPYNTSLPTILLAGPSGGGKTSLLTLLERGSDGPAETHTSQVAHAVELTVSSGSDDDSEKGAAVQNYKESAREDAPGSHKKFLLLDTPGHGKLRGFALSHLQAKNKPQSTQIVADPSQVRGVVYVLDASMLDETLSDTATYLYDLLLALQKRAGSSHTSRSPKTLDVLVAANKMDLFTALPASLVRGNLEAELGRIRRSRSKGLLDSSVADPDDATGAADEQDNWLGEYGSDKFSFAQLREFDIEVEVLGGSVQEGKVDKWWEWIAGRI
ncbi:signal recognition particle receptor beta subunit-domain-containing protein [Xylariaceae sp. FL0594]|nr:signal recognition particle receptor beta subunit-domain-containing protein [Xylariaceae sp. FL0594]